MSGTNAVNSEVLKEKLLNAKEDWLKRKQIGTGVGEFIRDVALNLPSGNVTRNELKELATDIANEPGDTYSAAQVKPFMSSILGVYDNLAKQKNV